MCLTAPGLVIAVDEDAALVRVGDVARRALTLLAPDVQPGDWVLVGAGAVIRRIGPDEAESTQRLLETTAQPTQRHHQGDQP